MRSLIAEALGPACRPVALYRSAEKDPEAKLYKERTSLKGNWGCAMHLLGQAFGGKTVAFSPETCHCPGSVQGLALNPPKLQYPGGPMAMLRFLSSGNEGSPEGLAAVEALRAAGASKDVCDDFLHGERFFKTPELALEIFKKAPRLEPNHGYLVAKPLERLEGEAEVVLMLADAQSLSALVILANYGRPSSDNVVIPFGAGCFTIWALPFAEAASERPRAVIGLTDISARVALKRLLGRNQLSFAMPWALFQEMESNVRGSFLDRPAWASLG
jgi:hypothetical protein